MTVFHQKGAIVTGLDATPQDRGTAAEGQGGRVVTKEAYLTPTASAAIDSTIQYFRLPSTAKVKELEVLIATAQDTTGMWDFGVYYPTNTPNHPAILLAADAIDQDCFSITALDAGGNAAYAKWVPGGGFRITNATPAIDDNSVWTEALANSPLWAVAGLTSDPGGELDIVATCTEAPGAATTPIYARVVYSL